MSDIKHKARELLGAEYKRTHDANPKCNFDEATYGCALRAIEAALRTSTADAGGRGAQDAARYRWLRDVNSDLSVAFSEGSNGPTEMYDGLVLDAAIDAAIAQREGS